MSKLFIQREAFFAQLLVNDLADLKRESRSKSSLHKIVGVD